MVAIVTKSLKNGGTNFRRYRRVKNSDKVLDAYDYGYKAWPIGGKKK